MSQRSDRAITSAYISSALVTSMRSTPGGAGSAVGPLTSDTRAPSSSAAAATAYPIFPLLWLVRKRTGSSASRVGPAVTRTLKPSSTPPRNRASIAGRDLVGLQHPARTDVAARLVALGGPQHRHTPVEQREHVRPRRARLPHLLVHRRSEHQRRRRREAQRREEIVGETVGEPGEHVGGGRRDEHQVRPPGELDVAHPGLGLLIEQLAVHGVRGERLEGQRGHELPRRRGHHDPHVEISVTQPSNQVASFVGRDAACDPEHDFAVGWSRHGG